MSRWENNILSNPESFGLTLVDCQDIAGAWEFDMFAIWSKGKRLFWATDSGCSCPSPFENYNSIEDLEHGPYIALVHAISTWGSHSYGCRSIVEARMRLLDAVNEWRRNVKGI